MSLKDADGAVERPDGRPYSLIHHYEEIANASRSMLEAAHLGDWAAVEQMELRCRELIETLKRASSRHALSEPEKKRRFAILRSILKDDAQIRARVEPWLRDLEEFLGSAPRAAKRRP